MRPWTVQDSEKLYLVSDWGKGYFGISKRGNVEVRVGKPNSKPLDLYELTMDLVERGLKPPLLLRFGDILQDRIFQVHHAFQRAISEYSYKGEYRGVFPIKVNQQRHVVEEVVHFGHSLELGLEVGSKPELLVALAKHGNPNSLIICNGFKDADYIEMALRGRQLGKKVFLVLDRLAELRPCLEIAQRLGVRPLFGIRAKLTSRGAGKWNESSGDRSKFGLTAGELLRVVETCGREGFLDTIQLLHFHVGSQITDIRAIKAALREASRIYVELKKLGAPMGWFDVGGGLGVDYDGSQSNFHSSMNYSLQEYANDVVFAIEEACDKEEISHPQIVSESGRALVAHHALLIFDVVGMSKGLGEEPGPCPKDGDPEILRKFYDLLLEVNPKNYIESYHDAVQFKEEASSLFNLGFLGLEGRARCENLFWAVCRRVYQWASEEDELGEELEPLRRRLGKTCFGNFSVFQSLPDHWAVKQLFPLMPIQRLDEEPNQQVIVADLTCDSDGKMDRFIGTHGIADSLRIHEPFEGKPYFLAVFLVGAYQEVLGDLHNLFGDTNVVHVQFDGEGGVDLGKVVEGDSLAEVLRYVQYDSEELILCVRRAAEKALKEGLIQKTGVQSFLRLFKNSLRGQTYLEEI
jgi:arginine decarboxylase